MIWHCEVLEITSSTQDIVKARAGQGAAEGLVVQALTQTGGRGRHGRVWEAGAGNLALSVLFRPSCPVHHMGQFSILAGLAVGRAVRDCVDDPAQVVLKWPNDALLGGRKCAGILIETDLDSTGHVNWVALGIGVNVAAAPLDTAACVQDFSSRAVISEDVREKLLTHLGALVEVWRGQGFAGIREQWLDIAHGRGAPVSVRIGAQVETGVFETIDDFGNLNLRGDDLRSKTISAGELYWD